MVEFYINNDKWIIEEKPKDLLLKMYNEQYDEEAYYVFGLTIKSEHKIYINKEMCKEQKIKTLKHELTHCYIWNYGLYNVPNFNEEMVCDLVSSINDFINDIVVKFKEMLDEENNMPVKKVKGGYKYGSKGKVYKQRSKAVKQRRAIKASKKRNNTK